MKVVALLAVRNEEYYMEKCLTYLYEQGIETCLIDNESTDRTLEIAQDFGTPLYVVNERMIRERYRSLKDALDLEYRNNQINYAVKANSNLSILKI